MKRPTEHGAALLTVLLLVAIIGAIAALTLDRLRSSMHLAINGAALDQARAYALAAEAIASARIDTLNGRGAGKTTLAGGWNGRRFRVPLPGGYGQLRISDGGNCFNLNSVVQGDATTGLERRPTGVTQFIALMRVIGIPEDRGGMIVAALADWIDSDAISTAGMPEDQAYSRARTPYRTGNIWIADVSELRAVAGITPEIYDRLRPWVCALPTSDLAPINVNTLLPEQTPLVAMLLPGMLDIATARSIIQARPRDGWSDLSAFWQLPVLRGHVPSMDVQGQPALATRWFRLDVMIDNGSAEMHETALIDAGTSPARVVARSWGDEAE